MSAPGTIGVIGVGVMGSAIARRLLQCGHSLVLFDRNGAALEPLLGERALAAESAADVARRADVVITSLNTAEIIDAVVFGPEGVASEGTHDKLLIDMSSTDPQATVSMARRLREDSGMGWVDAPLSGGAPAALEGRLTLMMGGSTADVARAKGVLADVARNMTHMGENGSGQTTKLINQVLCACGFLAVAEATRLAQAGGMDAARIPAALAGGRADSSILQEFMGKMAAYDLTPTGRIDNMLKDLEATQRFAMALRTPMPMTGLVTELHRMLVAGGYGAEDSAAYMALFDMGAAARGAPP
jgi:2-hydroxy-3-oxopropionate reductase